MESCDSNRIWFLEGPYRAGGNVHRVYTPKPNENKNHSFYSVDKKTGQLKPNTSWIPGSYGYGAVFPNYSASVTSLPGPVSLNLDMNRPFW